MSTTEQKQLKKKTSRAFGKNIYLLGQDSDGTNYWLERATWDCGWYWGFGYIETYTNNNKPHLSRDISSHQHADGEYGSDYDKNIFTGPFLVNKTFNDKEGWVLRELFKTFYHLKEEAELCGRGSMFVTENPLKELLKDPKRVKHINETLIPKIIEKVYEILEPKENSNV